MFLSNDNEQEQNGGDYKSRELNQTKIIPSKHHHYETWQFAQDTLTLFSVKTTMERHTSHCKDSTKVLFVWGFVLLGFFSPLPPLLCSKHRSNQQAISCPSFKGQRPSMTTNRTEMIKASGAAKLDIAAVRNRGWESKMDRESLFLQEHV